MEELIPPMLERHVSPWFVSLVTYFFWTLCFSTHKLIVINFFVSNLVVDFAITIRVAVPEAELTNCASSMDCLK